MKLELQGQVQLAAALRKAGEKLNKEIGDAINATGLELRGDIILRYQKGPASGRVYEKYKPRRTHQASKAGEAPMSDTGRLAGPVAFRITSALSAEVLTSVVYAPWLEFGTRSGKIAPRPAWVPAIEKARPRFNKRLQRAMERAAK